MLEDRPSKEYIHQTKGDNSDIVILNPLVYNNKLLSNIKRTDTRGNLN